MKMTETAYAAWQIVPLVAAVAILAATWLRYRR